MDGTAEEKDKDLNDSHGTNILGSEKLYVYYSDRCNILSEPAVSNPLNHRINSPCSDLAIISNLQTSSLSTCLIVRGRVSWSELCKYLPHLMDIVLI